jgi:predicted homoserine dehydrogenase-like protein
MNLSTLLLSRASKGRPVRAALIGAGKFGSMILSQIPRIEGLHMAAVVDLDVGEARRAFKRVGWADGRYDACSAGEAIKNGTTFITDDIEAMLACQEIECVIEATGHPLAGTRHALACIEHGKHVVMVNVEADVMVGPILAEKARAKGLIYSMAYGDQPALICELVDWARACGFEITAAGKGMNFEPRYRYSTPDTVWGLFGWSEEIVKKDRLNPKLYNSFTDGTKAAIEMAAVANGTGLDCPDDGLVFPPAGVHDLARVFRPVADGGRMARSGLVDIAASQEPDGREVFNNVRYGVFVTFNAHSEYARACFKQYGLLTDPSGWYASLWRPFHLIGLEASVSVLSAVLRNEATGSSREFRGDAVATAKRDMQSAEMLDGEGGFAVWAKAIPAARSLELAPCRWDSRTMSA